MVGGWRAGAGGALGLGLALGCGGAFAPQRVAHPGCECSVEVPGSWEEMDLVDEEVLELGSLYADRYVFGEFLPAEDLETGIDLLTLTDHFISDDMTYDAMVPPERDLIDGHPAALRWLRDQPVDDLRIDGVVAMVAYPDGYLRLYAWAMAGQPGSEEALLEVVRSARRTPEGPPATTLPEPFLDGPLANLRAHAEVLAVGRLDPVEWLVGERPEGLVAQRYPVPADPVLGPQVAMELGGWGSPVAAGERRPALVVLEDAHGLSDELEALLGEVSHRGEVVVFRPFLRGGPDQPGRWDVLGAELVDVVAAAILPTGGGRAKPSPRSGGGSRGGAPRP
jgi:hypothetical protein